MKIIVYFISLIISLSLFFSCDSDDSFSSNNSLRLTFSADTVRFDTVFTTIGTATKRVKVYNRNDDGLKLSSIEIMNPDKTGFRMNVDGMSGNKINNVEILGKDSLYIFVEVTVDPLDKNNPILVDDSIKFQFNGVTQYLRLEAIAQDVILWKGKTLDGDTTLTAEKPFLIYDGLTVSKNATLTVQKNVKFYFHNGAKMLINGRIDAVGTIEEPVLFRGDRMDNLYQSGNIPFDRVPGQWGGIEIAADSYNNNFENVRIRNSIYGVLCLDANPDKQKATFLNTIIQNTSKEGLWAVNCKITAKNSLFANSGGNTVRILGGSYDFLHCTIANYVDANWGFVPRKNALTLSNTGQNVADKTVSHALTKASFVNTIVAGRGTGELSLSEVNKTLDFKYSFLNCLIKSKGTDDLDFINTVWNVDPAFKYIYSLESAAGNTNLYYTYDYRLSENSPAIHKGSRQAAVDLPLDIIGVSRRNDEGPDIGCFEWKAN